MRVGDDGGAMTEWYYSKGEVQLGPVGRDELVASFKKGEISAADLVWREGMTAWTAYGSVAELQDNTVAGGGSVPIAQPVPLPADFVEEQIPNYMWQCVVALVASTVVCMFICLPIALPTGIVALVFSSKVEGLRVQGRKVEAWSASRTAKVCMIVTAVLCAIQILGVVGFVVFAITQS